MHIDTILTSGFVTRFATYIIIAVKSGCLGDFGFDKYVLKGWRALKCYQGMFRENILEMFVGANDGPVS